MSQGDGTMTMPFGKHRGKTIEEIPSSYLRWMVEELREARNEELVDEAASELKFRDEHDTHPEEDN